MKDLNKDVTQAKDGSWAMDVAAFMPEPEGKVRIGDVEYPIFGFLDACVEDSFRVIEVGDEINGAVTYRERMEKSIEQIILLNRGPVDFNGNPKHGKLLTAELLRAKLAPKQIIELSVLVSTVAAVPQTAGESQESLSVSSAPASADSTDGNTPR